MEPDPVRATRSAARDFALLVDSAAPLDPTQTKALCSSLDSTLARIDEFGAVVNSTKFNAQLLAEDVLPVLEQRAAQLERVYARIERVEALVRAMEVSVESVEKLHKQLEREFGAGKVRKFFTSLLRSGKKGDVLDELKDVKPQELVFRADDFVRGKERAEEVDQEQGS